MIECCRNGDRITSEYAAEGTKLRLPTRPESGNGNLRAFDPRGRRRSRSPCNISRGNAAARDAALRAIPAVTNPRGNLASTGASPAHCGRLVHSLTANKEPPALPMVPSIAYLVARGRFARCTTRFRARSGSRSATGCRRRASRGRSEELDGARRPYLCDLLGKNLFCSCGKVADEFLFRDRVAVHPHLPPVLMPLSRAALQAATECGTSTLVELHLEDRCFRSGRALSGHPDHKVEPPIHE